MRDEYRRPIIIIHSLAHAVAALSAAAEVGRAVKVISARNAGIYAGASWFRELISAAQAAVPAAQCTAILDCGDDAGAAQAAIRAGIESILFNGRVDVAVRLADIAGQRGARLLIKRPEIALDLGEDFFATPERLRQRCADVLASRAAFC